MDIQTPTLRTNMADDSGTNKGSNWLEKLSSALLGEPKDREQLVSILRDAEQRELLDSEALSMIEGSLHLCDMQVSEIMIPRGNMVVVPKEDSFEAISSVVVESAHSRFPVIGDNRDEVIGILLAKDLLKHLDPEHSERFHLRDLLRPAFFIPESKRLNVLLNEFRKSRNHLAIVVDEYGSVMGLVTIEDVLEQIVGDIEDEHDIDDEEMVKKHSDQSYTVKALMPIGEFNDYFKTMLDDEAFDTISGIVLQAFGHLPKRGESVTLEGLTFTVQKANRRRIQVLGVTVAETEES